jgi:hypothetical protein
MRFGLTFSMLAMVATTAAFAPNDAHGADPEAAAGSREILQFAGTWRRNVYKASNPEYIYLEVRQQGSDVHVIHRSGMRAYAAQGAELFHGTYSDLKVTGQQLSQNGVWVDGVMPVDDPDHIRLFGAVYERLSYPPAGNPQCDAGNRWHVKGPYAYSRGFQLSAAGQFPAALCWYTIAMELGDPQGVQGLAVAYGQGEGVAKDPVKAFELDSIAAEKGDMFAQGDLAYLYGNGIGVAKDSEKSAYWKRKHDVQAQAYAAKKQAGQLAIDDGSAPLLGLAGLAHQVLSPVGPNLKEMLRNGDHRPGLNGVWELQGRGTRYRIKQIEEEISITSLSAAAPVEMFKATFKDNVTLVGRVTDPRAPGDPNDTISVEAPDRISFGKGGTLVRVGQ